MAEFVPKLMQNKFFIRSKENVIASYNSTDVVEGSGIVNFYLGTTNLTGGIDYIMNTDIWRTHQSIFTTANTNHTMYLSASYNGAAAVKIDLDFDSKIYNRQVTLYGTGMATFRVLCSGLATKLTLYPVVTLYRYNATEGEVSIATATGESYTNNVSTTEARSYALPLVVPKTLIKVGDILRLTIQVYLATDGVAGYALLAYDPADREASRNAGALEPTAAAGQSQAVLQVPYLVDL
jgi:hypothetical protein